MNASRAGRAALALFIACNTLLLVSLWRADELDGLSRATLAVHYAYCTLGSSVWAQIWLSGASRLTAIVLWLLVGGALALSGQVRNTAVAGALTFFWVLGPRLLAFLLGCL